MRIIDLRFGVLVSAALIGATTLMPDTAAACGGCFGPVGSPTVVTRHQMAVSLSPTETTLWDQIEYAGEPEDFVWVLPVRGGVPVELAENAFFEALEQTTRITMNVNPPVQCSGGGVLLGASGSTADRFDDGVTVYHQANIGPYETATIGSTDPNALVAWLVDHGYAVPEEILPTIRHYTDQGMDFAVLRLSPNAGVNQMQPVRVTMPGLNPTFPLRMVSAGVVGKVGLELYVFAEGRYEAQNFANVEVDRSRISYDWATNVFNYDALYVEAAATEGGRVWVTEYASLPNDYSIRYYSSWDESGVEHSAADDWAVVTRGLSQPYLTRMTSDMPAEFLVEDLILQASAGPNLDSVIQVPNEENRPQDPVCWDGAGATSTGWRSGGRGDGMCSASPGAPGSWLSLAAIGLAIVVFRARRRR